MRRLSVRCLACCIYLLFSSLAMQGQPQFSEPHGLYDQASLTVAIMPTDGEAVIFYTTDGSEPTAQSLRYEAPLVFSSSTILRAVEVKDGQIISPIATASYIFTESVLSQPKNFL